MNETTMMGLLWVALSVQTAGLAFLLMRPGGKPMVKCLSELDKQKEATWRNLIREYQIARHRFEVMRMMKAFFYSGDETGLNLAFRDERKRLIKARTVLELEAMVREIHIYFPVKEDDYEK